MRKAKIIDKYTIQVIDYDQEKKMIDFHYNQAQSSLNNNSEDYLKTSELLSIEYNDAILELEKHSSFIESDPPSINETDSIIPYYELIDDTIYQRWEVIQNDPVVIVDTIEKLKQELSKSDYKITKCYEATLVGEELPYDIVALREERESNRYLINNLKGIIHITD